MKARLASMILQIENIENEGSRNHVIVTVLEELEELDYEDFKYVLGDLHERCDWGWAYIGTPEILEKLINISSRMFRFNTDQEAYKLRQWLANCEYALAIQG